MVSVRGQFRLKILSRLLGVRWPVVLCCVTLGGEVGAQTGGSVSASGVATGGIQRDVEGALGGGGGAVAIGSGVATGGNVGAATVTAGDGAAAAGGGGNNSSGGAGANGGAGAAAGTGASAGGGGAHTGFNTSATGGAGAGGGGMGAGFDGGGGGGGAGGNADGTTGGTGTGGSGGTGGAGGGGSGGRAAGSGSGSGGGGGSAGRGGGGGAAISNTNASLTFSSAGAAGGAGGQASVAFGSGGGGAAITLAGSVSGNLSAAGGEAGIRAGSSNDGSEDGGSGGSAAITVAGNVGGTVTATGGNDISSGASIGGGAAIAVGGNIAGVIILNNGTDTNGADTNGSGSNNGTGTGGGTASLTLNGSNAQTISSAIIGTGTVVVNNSAGVTLGDDVGTSGTRIGRLSLGSNTRVTLNGQTYVVTLAVGEDAASTVVLGGDSSRGGTTVIDAGALSGSGTVAVEVGVGVLSAGESLTLVQSAQAISGLTFNADGSNTSTTNYTVTQTSAGVITLSAAAVVTNTGGSSSLETRSGVSVSTDTGERVTTLGSNGVVVSSDAMFNIVDGVIQGTNQNQGLEVMVGDVLTLRVGQGGTQSTESRVVLAASVNASEAGRGRVIIQTNAGRTNNLIFRANSAMEATNINLGTGGGIALMGSNDTLIFEGNQAQTLTGTVSTGTAGQGRIRVNNTGGVVTFSGILGSESLPLGQVVMSAGTSTVLAQGANVGRLEVEGGVVAINAGVQVNEAGSSDGGVSLGDGSTLRVGSGFVPGETVIQATGSLTDTGTVNVAVEGFFVGGEAVTLIDAGSGVPSATYNVVSDTVLVDYEAETNAGDSRVVVRANFRPSEAVATDLGVTLQAARGLSEASQALALSARTGGAAEMFAQAIRTGGGDGEAGGGGVDGATGGVGERE